VIDPLIVDLYAGDFGGQPDLAKLVAAGYPWCGVILKATEGTYYPSAHQEDWFLSHWLPARELALERYGAAIGSYYVKPAMTDADQSMGQRIVPWYRGAYHYLRVDEDPIIQADHFLTLVERAGGWGPGDLWPMLDVEAADNPPAASSSAQIQDAVSRWASKVTAALGRSVMLYGNVYLAEAGITSHMNCGLLTVARYSPTLPPDTYQRIGWQLESAIPTLWGWQYSGDPDGGSLHGYPTKCPLSATENADIIAAIVAGGGDPWSVLDWTTANLSR